MEYIPADARRGVVSKAAALRNARAAAFSCLRCVHRRLLQGVDQLAVKLAGAFWLALAVPVELGVKHDAAPAFIVLV
jgi:hypothetical protein